MPMKMQGEYRLSTHPNIAEKPVHREDQTLPAELLRKADMDQLARVMRGAFVFPIFLAILTFTTSYKADHPVYFWIFAAIITVAISGRVALMVWYTRIYSAGPAFFNGALIGLIFLSSGICGLLYSNTLWFYGFESWTFAIVLIWVAGISSGSTIAFTPKFWLLQIHLLLLLGPVWGLAVFLGGKAGYSFAASMLAYTAFLLVQGRTQNRGYWKGLKDAALEQARTRELELAKISAEAASVAKGKFLANMSHEIRTPMHGILGMAQLAMTAETPQESRDYVKTLSGSAEGLLHVLNDILDFSKIEAGKLTVEETRFSIRQIIEETKKIIVPQAGAKGLVLSCHANSDVPDFLVGDPARLRQVLVNLVGNAVKFTGSGSVRLEVSLPASARLEDRIQLLFRVSDTGIGISPDQQKPIFEAFAQAYAGVSRKFGGTGLGLAICSQLVQLMGGQIWVESTPGVGSVFQFTCVFGVASGVASGPVPVAARAAMAEALAPMNILLAEDNPVNQMIASRLLSKCGHQVTVATTGLAAVEAWQSHEFDVVLMDNQMPELGGVEAVRRIRTLETASGRRRTVIIALTASAMSGDRQRFLDAGMDGYLAKPFRPEDLYEVLQIFHATTRSQQHITDQPAPLSPA